MEKAIEFLNGKKTYIGAAIYGMSLFLSQVVVGIWGYSPEWLINVIKSLEWTGGILAGIGVTHGLVKTKMLTKTPIIILIIALSFSSCTTPNKAMTKVIDYAKTHGEASKTTLPNGIVVYKAKYKNFYNADKLKAEYSKLTVNFDALQPIIIVEAATKDTTVTPQLPSFKK